MEHEPDERDWVQASRDGDTHAFDRLVRRYERPVFNAALRMVKDPEEARDIAQTVFVKAWQQLATFDPRFRFYSWLYRIAINESLNHLRATVRSGPIEVEPVSPADDPYRALESVEIESRVQDALMKLKPDHRTVIVLRHFLDCSYEDIATIVGVPDKTVKSRLFSARQELRILFEKEGMTR